MINLKENQAVDMEEPNKLSNRSGGVNIVEYKENVVPQSVDNMSDKK